jgi:hypothetical protein
MISCHDYMRRPRVGVKSNTLHGVFCCYLKWHIPNLWFFFQAAAASAKVASENKFQLYASSSSTGKLKIDSCEYEFKAEDLLDLGEIGRGAFGTVNKMLFQKANKGD